MNKRGRRCCDGTAALGHVSSMSESPCGKLALALLALVVGLNIRPYTPGDGLDDVLRDV